MRTPAFLHRAGIPGPQEAPSWIGVVGRGYRRRAAHAVANDPAGVSLWFAAPADRELILAFQQPLEPEADATAGSDPDSPRR